MSFFSQQPFSPPHPYIVPAATQATRSVWISFSPISIVLRCMADIGAPGLSRFRTAWGRPVSRSHVPPRDAVALPRAASANFFCRASGAIIFRTIHTLLRHGSIGSADLFSAPNLGMGPRICASLRYRENTWLGFPVVSVTSTCDLPGTFFGLRPHAFARGDSC